MNDLTHIPTVSVHYGTTGASKSSNELGMRVMQERAYNKRGEQTFINQITPASGKSRALMFIALDKGRKPRLETSHHCRTGEIN